MATFTSRLGLRKPDGNETRDLDGVLAENLDKVDDRMGAPGYSSNSRLGSPISGELIFETDLHAATVFANSQWTEAGIPVVASTADIDFPFAGQFVSLGGDLWQYNGTTWVLVAAFGVNLREAKYTTSGNQTFTHGTQQAVAYATGIWTSADVTKSGDHKSFTLNRGGVWKAEAMIFIPSYGGTTSGERKLSLHSAGVELSGATDHVGSTEGAKLSTKAQFRAAAGDVCQAQYRFTTTTVADRANDGSVTYFSYINLVWLRP